jgi:serine/threonine protein kinase
MTDESNNKLEQSQQDKDFLPKEKKNAVNLLLLLRQIYDSSSDKKKAYGCSGSFEWSSNRQMPVPHFSSLGVPQSTNQHYTLSSSTSIATAHASKFVKGASNYQVVARVVDGSSDGQDVELPRQSSIMKREGGHSTNQPSTIQSSTKEFIEMLDFTFAELQGVTHNFDSTPKCDGGHRLGAGSFGVVYYGCMPTQQMERRPQEIAVKKLKPPKTVQPSLQALYKKQFRTEIEALSRANHPNVIQLYGYSVDGPELCLVYEYLPCGTLAQCLSKDSTYAPNWGDRTRIARGIGKALRYLHGKVNPPLIHRDVKSSNVFLDNAWNPKLADFGLCTWKIEESSGVVSSAATTVVGTKAYLAPEVLKGYVSPKVDVYSYGMILNELITGLPPYSSSLKIDLITFLRELEEKTDLLMMADPRAMWPEHIASRYLKLARQSTEFDSHQRPRMSEIVKELKKLGLEDTFDDDGHCVAVAGSVAYQLDSRCHQSMNVDTGKQQKQQAKLVEVGESYYLSKQMVTGLPSDVGTELQDRELETIQQSNRFEIMQQPYSFGGKES